MLGQRISSVNGIQQLDCTEAPLEVFDWPQWNQDQKYLFSLSPAHEGRQDSDFLGSTVQGTLFQGS